VDDVGVDLLGYHGQPALLPGEPGGPVRERRRAGHHSRVRGKPLVPFLVGPLADNGQIRARDIERADQSVNVPAERAPVGWHVGRIN
jgi:hypothetical protein